jgi:sec-independent protein translocase protein TatA
MFGLGVGELALVSFLILLIFGGRKIPELGSSLAKGLKNFQKGMKSESNENDGDDYNDRLT